MSRMTRLTVPLERQEQQWLVDWLSFHPILKEFFYKTNNEAKRTPQQAYFLRRMGLKTGVSDIHICYPTKTHPGLFLEVKRNKKYTPSEMNTNTWKEQEKFIERMKSVGFQGHFCYGWVDGREIIQRYLLT